MPIKTERALQQAPGTYVGETQNQVRHGEGKYVYGNSFFQYSGTWVEGVKHGKGVIMMKDGGYYRGDFSNGEMTGKGERAWDSGNVYVGEFEKGELNGFGQMKYWDGRRYDGNWCDNKYEGQGTFHSGKGDIYTGQFHLHKRHGDGEQVWCDGRRYDGGWVADKPHGHGSMKFADGSVYEGQCYHGVKQGQGTYTHVTGITYSGLWIQDEMPPEEFANVMVFVGSTEVEVYQGEPFSIEIAVLHTNGDVMEGDTGRMLDARVGLLAPPGDGSTKVIKAEEKVVTFESPFGAAKAVKLAEVAAKKEVRQEEAQAEAQERPQSRGYDYIRLPTPVSTATTQRTHCGHASWVNVIIPAPTGQVISAFNTPPDEGHEMLEVVESEEDEVEERVEESKPKSKKKGKNSPARKDRSVTPSDERDRWRMGGARAERDKDLLKFAAAGTYVIKICDVTEPSFFGRLLQPIFLKVNVLRVKKSSTKYLLAKSPVINRKAG